MGKFRMTLQGVGKQLLVCGMAALAVYYLADATMDSLVFKEGTFTEQLLHPTLHELCIRLLHALFQSLVLVFAWRLFKQRRQVEARLEESNRQLQQANSELEIFNDSLAHDLRTPLTGLAMACSLLKEQPAEPAEGQPRQMCLKSIESSCQRIERTVNGLLKLSNLRSQPLNRLPVDLSKLADDTLQALSATAPERRIEADIAAGVSADADPELIAVLLENLVGNAWKFSAGQPVLKLAFGTTRHRHRQAFFLRDNGVGFDMQQVGRLFRPFSRLHDNQQFPGQGIGLATARRIVSRHGGEIWAESAPGRGTTFYFTLQPG